VLACPLGTKRYKSSSKSDILILYFFNEGGNRVIIISYTVLLESNCGDGRWSSLKEVA
jgi:hypothetical protein